MGGLTNCCSQTTDCIAWKVFGIYNLAMRLSSFQPMLKQALDSTFIFVTEFEGKQRNDEKLLFPKQMMLTILLSCT